MDARVEKIETYAEKLASYVLGLKFTSLPEKVIGHTKLVLMDAIGCAIGSARLNKAWCMAALKMARAQGGAKQSTIWHFGDRVPSLNAAFVNGVFAHALDFSDDLAGVQIGGIVPTTAFAIGEAVGASGKEIIVATVVGYDLAGRLAESMDSQGLYIMGLQPTAMLGGFAAAATAGKLLRLTPPQLTSAFGIVASYAGGTIEFLKEGTDTKRMHPGKCGQSGALAAYLAKGGMTGPRTIFEGDYGIFKAYSDNPNLPKLLEDLGKRFDVLDTSIKPLPMCDGNFAPLEAALAIVRDNGLALDEIESLSFRMIPSLIPYVINFQGETERKYRPITELDAQMSIPYTIAVGLLKDGKVRMEDFHPRNYKNPKIQALADRIAAESAPDLSAGTPRRPITMPAEATLKTKSGRTFQKRIDRHKGDPRNPLSEAELIEKFGVCVKGSLSEAKKQRALGSILSLEKAKDMSKLMRCLVRS